MTAIKGYSAEQVRGAEAPHLAVGEPLMQRAAAGLAAEIRNASPRRVLLLVGSGNNGADTLYAGAELASENAEVAILATGSRVNEDAMAAALKAGASVVDAAGLASPFDVIVDGILGTGTSANPALRGEARAVVAAILPALSAHPRPLVVAADIPSGIDPNDGRVPDPLVLPADVTVTFGAYKAGLLLEPASRLVGRVVLVDIGLGPDLDALTPLVVVRS
ncbi:MAG: NAD(P)H-hydrate epimerase [Frondihabitans sp.]|nr:NAD(P)H-hydrate epimerase [Frondihabitans sp.]